MFELVDGVISIIGGIWCYLVATGKLKVGKSQDDSTSWLNRNGKLLKIVGPLLFVFGIFRLFQVLFIS
ncbi:hypothetical protein C4G48_RS22815 [Vibrio parahaemolyticus]|nr:hypothetical protein [Vibrio parahaemolyticus]EHR6585491.1 hypothetical protein [Vibrio parahaemolyticus]EIT7136642.1 hypothetical protein [Vibrio parahaemolyticus]EIV8632236.1 hypothetical protein [Vibrio parahaemolyticus]EJG0899114.1 hypothetical protein [Vibrio parahaemolyticus]